MYYKAIMNNQIVDALENLQCVRFFEKSGLLRCKEKDSPQGIISSDGQYAWQVEGWPELPAGNAAGTVSLIEICQGEYENLKQQLDSRQDIPEQGETPSEQPEIMSPMEMRVKINELTTAVGSLTERNEMLEECLMEMSEIVYA